MFVLQKLLARPGLFRRGAVRLAPARPSASPDQRPRITLADVRLASLGIVLDRLDQHPNHGGRP